ncbi:hypothetical protein SNE40_023557 [Patella caerulea]|uniref:Dixin n=1 Tax=Patella caerulea TaxID=87958 RepID=A0AAN8G7I0_PATCE
MNISGSSASSIKSPEPDEGAPGWIEWQQQLDAYKAWVNSQLRKRPNTRPIDDLRLDIRDGKILADLIEIVGGEKLPGIHTSPSNKDEMIDNVHTVLQFVSQHKIRMHEMSAIDIVEGNLKSIMRLILALAAHYKPSSVKHSSYHHIKSPAQNANVTGIAQDAAVALAEARRNAARAGHRHRRTRESTIAERRYGHRYQDSSSEQFSDSDHSQSGHHSRSRRELRQLDSASHSSHSSSARLSPRCYNTPTKNLDYLPRSKSMSIDHIHAKDSGAELEDAASVVDKSQYDELLQEYTDLALSMQETKTELVMLQELLLRGEDSGDTEDATNELIRQLHTKDKCIAAMKHDIVKLQDEITLQIHEKEKVTSDLRCEIRDLLDQMHIVGATGASLSARVASQDKRMARLEGKIFQANPEDGSHSIKPEYQSSATELHVVRDSLQSLRRHFETSSPHNHTIDTLEQSIALLIEKLHTTETSPLSHTIASSRSLMDTSPKKLNYDSAPEKRSSSSINMSGFRMNKPSNSQSTQNGNPPSSTNVLYFTDTSVTPKICKIQKKLGDIKLRDFKKLFDRPSIYRYHFKALDPEYGTVKEEVANDDDTIPGWEGKIVAWVEADLQTEC